MNCASSGFCGLTPGYPNPPKDYPRALAGNCLSCVSPLRGHRGCAREMPRLSADRTLNLRDKRTRQWCAQLQLLNDTVYLLASGDLLSSTNGSIGDTLTRAIICPAIVRAYLAPPACAHKAHLRIGDGDEFRTRNLFCFRCRSWLFRGRCSGPP